MSTDIHRFVAVAAAYIMDRLAPPLAAFLAQEGADDVADNAGRDALRAALAVWMADIAAGRAEAALAPTRFADAIEAIWTLSIVAAQTPVGQADPDWVDVLLAPDGARATAIALAAARALDLLRGTDVAGEVGARQRQMVERIAAGVAVQARAQHLH